MQSPEPVEASHSDPASPGVNNEGGGGPGTSQSGAPAPTTTPKERAIRLALEANRHAHELAAITELIVKTIAESECDPPWVGALYSRDRDLWNLVIEFTEIAANLTNVAGSAAARSVVVGGAKK